MREIRKREGAISIAAVAKVLGRGREVIVRAEALRAVVEAERNVARLEMETKIRAAANALEESGESITVAAVCRELKLHRSYLEKRGRLREIVLRARKP